VSSREFPYTRRNRDSGCNSGHPADIIQHMTIRTIGRILDGIPTQDGAGVKLSRLLGTPRLKSLDPFLLLDEFKSDNTNDFIAGFPEHPHRGFETVTYLKRGKFHHRDSSGNQGLLTAGSVQWMTAGKGIIHSEMPEVSEGSLWGYQLWINLPSRLKMIEPQYQDIPSERIPRIETQGAQVAVISGEFDGSRGPAQPHFPVIYLDVELSAQSNFAHSVPAEMNCFCYLYDGSIMPAAHGPDRATVVDSGAGRLIVLQEGESVLLRTASAKAGFLLIAGRRIGEPVARAGPFVMNTREELYRAFDDYRSGRFVDIHPADR